MVLHELATNAAKYGALSTESGRVAVRWHCCAHGSASTALFLEWQERGGPSVIAPTICGYGTSVICDFIPYELGGAVDLMFGQEGGRLPHCDPRKMGRQERGRTARRGLASSYLEKVGDALSLNADTLPG